MQAKIVIVDGLPKRKVIALELPATLGRSRDAGATVPHPMISRRHCEISDVGGLVRVRDLGSTNGIQVGGKRVAEALLRPGGQFSIGPLVFEVDYEYVGDVTIAETSDVPPAGIRPAGGDGDRRAAGGRLRATQVAPPPAETTDDALGLVAETRSPVEQEFTPPSEVIEDVAAEAESPSVGFLDGLPGVAPPDGQLPDVGLWADEPPHAVPIETAPPVVAPRKSRSSGIAGASTRQAPPASEADAYLEDFLDGLQAGDLDSFLKGLQ